ncbi:MAG: alpha-L-fucosidase [Planctomycetota bacterium]|jgi:alpha-L-fucosidase|nr:alpha-L-fucosidase [Planctomycetota bacterium]MDP6762248.1 alpha-L-fucosidase [Planctomycetota bacterium]MDP6989349.1 alpha-L-fucosidase [Planctomycetota bacterium]
MIARLCFLLACVSGPAAAQEITEPSPPVGFESLFTGRDLYGWLGWAAAPGEQAEAHRSVGEHWRAEGGELVAVGGVVGLQSERSYRCFELLVDWRAAEGVGIALGLRGTTAVALGATSDGAGTVTGLPPLVRAEAPAGAWNNARVRVTPRHVSVWVNGAPTVWHHELAASSAGASPAFAAPLTLAVEGGEVRFRDLFLRVLPEEAMAGEGPRARAERAGWWSAARLGVAIDWGLYSVCEGEWDGEAVPGPRERLMDSARIPVEEYAQLTGRLEGGGFDAAGWARTAQGAGAGYLVVTSKHPDGFAMFDSEHTEFDIGATPFGRDVMAEVAEAARAAGLRLGWRHSIADWHHDDYLPRRPWDTRGREGARPERYHAEVEGQVVELLTRYGDVDLLWFDAEDEGGWTRGMGQSLFARARAVRPRLLVNDRAEAGRLDPDGERDPALLADFATPLELPSRPAGLWELALDLDDAVGEEIDAEGLIRTLCETAGAGGNLLLGVSAGSDGALAPATLDRLGALGGWLDVHGASIRETTAGPFPDPAWGACTGKGTLLYLHVFEWPEEESLVVGGLENGIDKAWMLSDPQETFLPLQRVEGDPVIDLSAAQADETVSVIVLAIDGEPDVR